MPVSFSNIKKGHSYTRHQLAEAWGYATYHPLARGVVTPRKDNKIILFVTEGNGRYADRFTGHELEWEGPTDHFAEERMVNAGPGGDEIHLFYRDRGGERFVYCGRLAVMQYELLTHRPSRFTFNVR